MEFNASTMRALTNTRSDPNHTPWDDIVATITSAAAHGKKSFIIPVCSEQNEKRLNELGFTTWPMPSGMLVTWDVRYKTK